MPISDRIEMRGHILDTGELPRVLNEILEGGGDFVIERFEIGKLPKDESWVQIMVSADSVELLREVVNRLQEFGANLLDPGEPEIVEADVAGSLPLGFYSSTNFETEAEQFTVESTPI